MWVHVISFALGVLLTWVGVLSMLPRGISQVWILMMLMLLLLLLLFVCVCYSLQLLGKGNGGGEEWHKHGHYCTNSQSKQEVSLILLTYPCWLNARNEFALSLISSNDRYGALSVLDYDFVVHVGVVDEGDCNIPQQLCRLWAFHTGITSCRQGSGTEMYMSCRLIGNHRYSAHYLLNIVSLAVNWSIVGFWGDAQSWV